MRTGLLRTLRVAKTSQPARIKAADDLADAVAAVGSVDSAGRREVRGRLADVVAYLRPVPRLPPHPVLVPRLRLVLPPVEFWSRALPLEPASIFQPVPHPQQPRRRRRCR